MQTTEKDMLRGTLRVTACLTHTAVLLIETGVCRDAAARVQNTEGESEESMSWSRKLESSAGWAFRQKQAGTSWKASEGRCQG